MVNKLAMLKKRLKSLAPLAIAFSGGIDSRFLAYLAKIYDIDAALLHITGPHMPYANFEYAKSWAKTNSLPLIELKTNPLLLPEVANNTRKRCYFCKKEMFKAIMGMAGRRNVCDGTNADDFNVFRPGLRALNELSINSPLKDLTKNEIRQMAAFAGMDNINQHSGSCLLTRLNYNINVKKETLLKIDECEKELETFFCKVLENSIAFRLRLSPAPLLHTECDISSYYTEIRNILELHGFKNCIIEKREKLSGFFDKKI